MIKALRMLRKQSNPTEVVTERNSAFSLSKLKKMRADQAIQLKRRVEVMHATDAWEDFLWMQDQYIKGRRCYFDQYNQTMMLARLPYIERYCRYFDVPMKRTKDPLEIVFE